MIESPCGKKYIGITTRPFKRRWKDHIACSRRNGNLPLQKAIIEHGEENFKCKVLVIASDFEYLADLEKRAIAIFKTKYPNGYNLTSGGAGFQNLHENVRTANREKLKLAWADPEKRKARLEKSNSKEVKERHRQATIKFTSDPEYRKAVSIRSKIALSKPEVKKKISENSIKSFSNPEVKERHKNAMKVCMSNPDRRKRISEKMKLIWKQRKEKL